MHGEVREPLKRRELLHRLQKVATWRVGSPQLGQNLQKAVQKPFKTRISTMKCIDLRFYRYTSFERIARTGSRSLRKATRSLKPKSFGRSIASPRPPKTVPSFSHGSWPSFGGPSFFSFNSLCEAWSPAQPPPKKESSEQNDDSNRAIQPRPRLGTVAAAGPTAVLREEQLLPQQPRLWARFCPF